MAAARFYVFYWLENIHFTHVLDWRVDIFIFYNLFSKMSKLFNPVFSVLFYFPFPLLDMSRQTLFQSGKPVRFRRPVRWLYVEIVEILFPEKKIAFVNLEFMSGARGPSTASIGEVTVKEWRN